MDPDLYAALGVSRGATRADIKKAYRRLARELHPDRRPGDRAAEERFKRVSYAYQVLNDPQKRKLYDEFGSVGLREGFDATAYRGWQQRARGPQWSSGLEEILQQAQQQEGGAGGLHDIFSGRIEDLLGGRRRGRAGRRGRDLAASLSVGFVEALEGVEREITVAGPGGARTLKARIPAGVRDGEKLRLRGQGGPAPGRRGESGDLILTVSVEEHPWFWREQNDLHLRLPVTPSEAYRGARVRVPTLAGDMSLSVPAGTQSGTKLRLRGRGAPARGRGNGAGDLFVHVEVQLPPQGSARVEELLEQLDEELGADVRADVRL